MYGVGSLIGPPAAGLAMDLWNPNGLPGFLALVCAVYLALGLATFMHRRTQP
jgi:hypothetical protein